MAVGWLEALNAIDLGIAIAGNHYAAVQTMDEEHRQNINYNGAFGADGPVVRSVRKAEENTVSFSAILLKEGEDIGMADEQFLLGLDSFRIVTKRGTKNYVYDECAWNTVRTSSTLDQVTLNADFSVPGYKPPAGNFFQF